MCGIVGIVGVGAVNQRLYDALTVLQHRGQDAAGITTCGEGELYVRKGSGLVRDVFQQHHMLELKGNVGIGHVDRKSTRLNSSHVSISYAVFCLKKRIVSNLASPTPIASSSA